MTKENDTEDKKSRGRPKGSPNMKTLLTQLANQKHHIKGESKSFTTLELAVIILRHETMKGNLRAISLRDRFFKDYLEPELTGGNGVLVAAEGQNAETWMKRMELKNQKLEALAEEVKREPWVK